MGVLKAVMRAADGTEVVYDMVPSSNSHIAGCDHQRIMAKLSALFQPSPGAEWINWGVLSYRVVTNAFANLLVDALQGISGATINTFKYHDSGTGTTAEAVTDTTLVTPCGEARDVGTQTEGATSNIYKSVATHNYTTSGALVITEHGLFSASSGGILLDRSVFANNGIPVVSGASIQFTYQLQIVAGG